MTMSQQISEWGFLIATLQAVAAFMAIDGLAWVAHGDYGLLIWSLAYLAALTGLLAYSLAVHARDSGYSRTWALLAPLGVMGVLVVHVLPDRTARPGHGFPLEFRHGNDVEGGA